MMRLSNLAVIIPVVVLFLGACVAPSGGDKISGGVVMSGGGGSSTEAAPLERNPVSVEDAELTRRKARDLAWKPVATPQPILVTQGSGTAVLTRAQDGSRLHAKRDIGIVDKFFNNLTEEQLQDARLYVTTDGGLTWKKTTVGLVFDKPPYFKFRSDFDGLHGFYSITADEADPVPGTEAEALVYFDTQSPAVEVFSPLGDKAFYVGEKVTLRYRAEDPNLDNANGIDIAYSTDGGVSWTKLVEGVAVSGSFDWLPGFAAETKVNLKVTARDVLGHSSEAQSQVLTVSKPRPEPVRTVSDRPFIRVRGPDKIYFEHTDFYFEVVNHTNSPTSKVKIYYSMDDGLTWRCTTYDSSGKNEGKLIVYFTEPFRRNVVSNVRGYRAKRLFGSYQVIQFYYQVVTLDGVANMPDPTRGSPHMASFAVDTAPPKLTLHYPGLGELHYRGEVPGNAESGKYFINWSGDDINPVPFVTRPGYERGPVSIWYTSTPRAEFPSWTLLAEGLSLTGDFIRSNDLPLGELEVKVVAEDQMGNKSTRYSGIFEVRDGVPDRNIGWGDAGDHIENLWSEGKQNYDTGNYTKAASLLSRAADIAPTDRKDSVIHDLARTHYRQGKVKLAKKEMSQIIAHQPSNLTFRYTMANMHYLQGELALAKEQCESIDALDELEPHVAAHGMLAEIYFGEGWTGKAKAQWKFVLKHGSTASIEYKRATYKLAELKRLSGGDSGDE